MMNYVFGALIVLSVVVSLVRGSVSELSGAALSEGYAAIKICLELCGTVAVWCGVMNVAKRSGLCDKLSCAMSPLVDFLFKGLRARSPHAADAVSLNITANLLGLGSAATPSALSAMREFDRLNSRGERASDHMVKFVVLNTASFQLVPATVAAIRRAAGSAHPLDIALPVWIASGLSVTVAMLVAFAGCRKKR